MNHITFKNVILFFTGMLFFVSSCTYKVPEYGLLDKGKHHGTLSIKVNENGKQVSKKVERVKYDTLEHQQLIEVNIFLNSIRPLYTKSLDFIIISYYPGKDRSNSTGLATRDDIGVKDKIFIHELNAKENITGAWIFKDSEGLDRFSKIPPWTQDKSQLIESTFFEYHYLGSSYVILHKSGVYYSYFGESHFRQKLEDIDLFMDLFEKE